MLFLAKTMLDNERSAVGYRLIYLRTIESMQGRAEAVCSGHVAPLIEHRIGVEFFLEFDDGLAFPLPCDKELFPPKVYRIGLQESQIQDRDAGNQAYDWRIDWHSCQSLTVNSCT